MFIFIKGDITSVYKFTNGERASVKSLISSLTIKRIPEPDIIKAIFDQTGKTISDRYFYTLKEQIEKESYGWYKAMRQSRYTYVHEFKERINEILWLQRKHHEIIDNNPNPSVQQASLAELHRLNITLSNYFAVAPTVVNDFTIPTITTATDKATATNDIIV
jgi:hypothetical protein